MNENKYLVWSNEHKAWWKPNQCGYTNLINEAGRYSLNEAVGIVQGANWQAKEKLYPEQDCVPDEILCIAPEYLEG